MNDQNLNYKDVEFERSHDMVYKLGLKCLKTLKYHSFSRNWLYLTTSSHHFRIITKFNTVICLFIWLKAVEQLISLIVEVESKAIPPPMDLNNVRCWLWGLACHWSLCNQSHVKPNTEDTFLFIGPLTSHHLQYPGPATRGSLSFSF